jgi:ferredoxin
MDKKLTVYSSKCPQNHPCPAVKICPAGALTQNGFSAPDVSYDKCTGCGACSKFCPKGALVIA